MLTSYVQVVNTLLQTSATADIIAEADTSIVRFTQLQYVSPLRYANALWMKILRCPQVYDDSVLKEMFVEGLPLWIGHSMSSFRSSNTHDALQKLAYEAESLTKLQEAAQGVDTSNGYSSIQR